MGVTLERVQNKFACIIGELCSEPDILSEFAIWLDLRLAEYKAKGAIQLECSGETPDPTWLRGHKQPPKRIKTPKMERLHHFDSAPEYNEDMSHEVSQRLSPEIVVVKEERPDDTDIFPVDMYHHDNSSINTSTSRKRSSTDGSSMQLLDKMPRLSPSTSVLEPVNQSLMSIISENTADDSADMSRNLSTSFSNIDSSNIDNSSFIASSHPLPSTSREEYTDQQDGSNSDRCQLLQQAGRKSPVPAKMRMRLYRHKLRQNKELYEKRLEYDRLKARERRVKVKDLPDDVKAKKRLRAIDRERQKLYRQLNKTC